MTIYSGPVFDMAAQQFNVMVHSTRGRALRLNQPPLRRLLPGPLCHKGAFLRREPAGLALHDMKEK